MEPVRSPNTLLTRGTSGTGRSAVGGGEDSKSTGNLNWKGQWVDTDYDQGDIVICMDPEDEIDPGRICGTYIAKEAISAGSLHPGIEPQTGVLSVTLAAGAVSAIDVTDGGNGYASAPAVTITGDGSGAAAHAVITNHVVTSIVIDNPGTGYTTITASLDAPGMTQKWEDFALLAPVKQVHRPKNQSRALQEIVIDAGRDPGTLPIIRLRKTLGSTVNSVSIDLNDIPVDAGNKELKIREWGVDVCTSTAKALFISSDSYT